VTQRVCAAIPPARRWPGRLISELSAQHGYQTISARRAGSGGKCRCCLATRFGVAAGSWGGRPLTFHCRGHKHVLSAPRAVRAGLLPRRRISPATIHGSRQWPPVTSARARVLQWLAGCGDLGARKVGRVSRPRPIGNRPTAGVAPHNGVNKPPRRLQAGPTSLRRFHFRVAQTGDLTRRKRCGNIDSSSVAQPCDAARPEVHVPSWFTARGYI
jgi:hypothetical protein